MAKSFSGKIMHEQILLGGAMACCLLLFGCDGNMKSDADDEKNVRVKNGLEQAKLRQWDAAILQFENALAHSGELASPELELALIYHQQKKNYVRAIYHYEQYLKKRPNSQKAPLIADRTFGSDLD